MRPPALAPAGAPRAAPACFPHPGHRSLDAVDSADPARWRVANRPYFDAIYGSDQPVDRLGRPNPRMAVRKAGLLAARRWRIANKARFDALYGPEEPGR